MSKYLCRPLNEGRHRSSWEKVSFIYWWPGRELEYHEELPEKFQSLVRRCERAGTKYLVFAYTYVPGHGVVCGYSRCMDIDNPNKKYGRDKALGWLQKHLLELDYCWVQVDTGE